MTIDQRDRIDQRITDYLSTGGLFNPEMADHRKVRDLLIDIRDYMANCLVVEQTTEVVLVSAENDVASVRRDQKG